MPSRQRSNAAQPPSPRWPDLLDNHDRLTGFFVKNLENVQGDERDIIIFSIGYGPDETGKLSMNFGPINREGGWRRLNVAITRARKRVEVVSSFRAGDMRETSSEGLRHLKGYLDFAARGMPALAMDLEESLGDAESPFEEDVMRVISSWGYDVVPQVGSAGYRIDMGVRHPDRPGEFVLGVECDGAAYHSAASARDRDRLRASVLEGLGWRLHRIWGISWYRDRVGQAALLKAAIESAIAGVTLSAEAVVVEEALIELDDFDPDTAPEWAVPYAVCDARAPHLWESLGSIGSRPALQDYITKVLEMEAPIHRDVLNARVRSAFGVGGIGSAIKENIDFVTRRITIGGRKVSIRQDGFIRVPDMPIVVRTPVDEEGKRHVSQVAPEELDLAVLRVIKDAVSTDEVGRHLPDSRGLRLEAAPGRHPGCHTGEHQPCSSARRDRADGARDVASGFLVVQRHLAPQAPAGVRRDVRGARRVLGRCPQATGRTASSRTSSCRPRCEPDLAGHHRRGRD